MIKTIIFDIGNVLVHFRWKEDFQSLGYDTDTIDKRAQASVLNPDWKEMDLGNLPYEEIIHLFVENDPSMEKELCESLADLRYILGATDYAVPWLKGLKQKGLKLLFL